MLNRSNRIRVPLKRRDIAGVSGFAHILAIIRCALCARFNGLAGGSGEVDLNKKGY